MYVAEDGNSTINRHILIYHVPAGSQGVLVGKQSVILANFIGVRFVRGIQIGDRLSGERFKVCSQAAICDSDEAVDRAGADHAAVFCPVEEVPALVGHGSQGDRGRLGILSRAGDCAALRGIGGSGNGVVGHGDLLKVCRQAPVSGSGKAVRCVGADRVAVLRPVEEAPALVGHCGQGNRLALGVFARAADVAALRGVGGSGNGIVRCGDQLKVRRQAPISGSGEAVFRVGADRAAVLRPVHKAPALVGHGSQSDGLAFFVLAAAQGKAAFQGRGFGGNCVEMAEGSRYDHVIIRHDEAAAGNGGHLVGGDAFLVFGHQEGFQGVTLCGHSFQRYGIARIEVVLVIHHLEAAPLRLVISRDDSAGTLLEGRRQSNVHPGQGGVGRIVTDDLLSRNAHPEQELIARGRNGCHGDVAVIRNDGLNRAALRRIEEAEDSHHQHVLLGHKDVGILGAESLTCSGALVILHPVEEGEAIRGNRLGGDYAGLLIQTVVERALARGEHAEVYRGGGDGQKLYVDIRVIIRLEGDDVFGNTVAHGEAGDVAGVVARLRFQGQGHRVALVVGPLRGQHSGAVAAAADVDIVGVQAAHPGVGGGHAELAVAADPLPGYGGGGMVVSFLADLIDDAPPVLRRRHQGNFGAGNIRVQVGAYLHIQGLVSVDRVFPIPDKQCVPLAVSLEYGGILTVVGYLFSFIIYPCHKVIAAFGHGNQDDRLAHVVRAGRVDHEVSGVQAGLDEKGYCAGVAEGCRFCVGRAAGVGCLRGGPTHSVGLRPNRLRGLFRRRLRGGRDERVRDLPGQRHPDRVADGFHCRLQVHFRERACRRETSRVKGH